MTDRDLALALQHAMGLEAQTRKTMQTEDLAERDQAVNALRLVAALRRSLETWISLRAIRTQLQSVSVK